MGHEHHQHSSGKNLKLAFFLNLGFTILEFIGGIYVNSIAIISDAVHDLGDSLSLGTSWYLDHKSKQKSNSKFSFGYRRFSLLGALINSVVLIGGSVYVIYEAVERLMYPEHSDAQGMMFFAIIGVAVNGFAAYKLSSGKTLNEKVVSWHLMEDVLGWVAVLVVSIILQFKDIHYLDPALSLAITLYILWNVFKRLKETLFIFLQGTPRDINLIKVRERIESIKGVASTHHVHIWSQEGEHHVFTAHVKLHNVNGFQEYLKLKAEVLKTLESYNFEHFTVQFELDSETCILE
ncbi:cation diffusion facilitator family transporter [Salegentibacter maritimus]|uniref:Cation transporter n=1 Tax=Salegentibacter maritimus TaxID=2794347 RepID=A0ABS0TE90_9FLAO|nr:cation diffusion facilitator family transporter [Salegentibacter maritimus]MBI6119110.1 cation transporter [Salegentibacter maritimus]